MLPAWPVDGSLATSEKLPIGTPVILNIPSASASRTITGSAPKMLHARNVSRAFGTGTPFNRTTPVTVPEPRNTRFTVEAWPVCPRATVARARAPETAAASRRYSPSVTSGNSYPPPSTVNVVASGIQPPAWKISTLTPEDAGVVPPASNTTPFTDAAGIKTTLTATDPSVRAIVPVLRPYRRVTGSIARTSTTGPRTPSTW